MEQSRRSQRKPRGIVYAWRDAIRASNLDATSRAVAQAISFFMDSETGGSAFPGKARLGSDTGLSPKTVGRALHKLVDHGWLRLELAGGTDRDGTRRPNRYAAAFPSPGTQRHRGQPDPGDNHGGPRGQADLSPGSQSPGISSLTSSDTSHARRGRPDPATTLGQTLAAAGLDEDEARRDIATRRHLTADVRERALDAWRRHAQPPGELEDAK